jgi:hydroxymethylbilane synthase
MLPAVGQGAVAIETRSDNELAFEATQKLSHLETRLACQAERAFLRILGGGCQFPIAAHAIVDGDTLTLDGLIATPDGSKILRDSQSGPVVDAQAVGIQLADRLLAQGAQALLNVL